MYNVAIYFFAPGKLDYPFDQAAYYESYRDFTAFCTERNMNLYFVRADSYLGDMQFKSGWQFIGNDLVETTGPIQVDLIYVKD